MTGPRNLAVAAVALIAIVLPLVATDFFISFVMTRVMIFAVIASTVVFLNAYGGLVSLAQLFIAGTAGFVVGNVSGESGGLALGLPQPVGIGAAVVVGTLLAAALGALSARSTGIYYLMLTLTFSVIGFYFFNQVVSVSGSTGLSGIDPPGFLGNDTALYYAVTALGLLAYGAFRFVATTPFGIALQGVRDDPVRMGSLGFNVGIHRALAFTMCGFVASLGGLFMVWWNGQIDPRSINVGPTIDLLIIAVIGGITYLEGAWLGAFVFVIANQYLRSIPLLDRIGLDESRFNTVIGLIVLLIMVASPDGIAGLLRRLGARTVSNRSSTIQLKGEPS